MSAKEAIISIVFVSQDVIVASYDPPRLRGWSSPDLDPLFDLAIDTPLVELTAHGTNVWGLAGRSIRGWDTRTAEPLPPLEPELAIKFLVIRADVLFGAADSHVRLWRWSGRWKGERLCPLESGSVIAFAVSPDGGSWAVCDEDNRVFVYESRKAHLRWSEKVDAAPSSLCLTDQHLYIATSEGVIARALSGGHERSVPSMAYVRGLAQCAGLMAGRIKDRAVQAWDVAVEVPVFAARVDGHHSTHPGAPKSDSRYVPNVDQTGRFVAGADGGCVVLFDTVSCAIRRADSDGTSIVQPPVSRAMLRIPVRAFETSGTAIRLLDTTGRLRLMDVDANELHDFGPVDGLDPAEEAPAHRPGQLLRWGETILFKEGNRISGIQSLAVQWRRDIPSMGRLWRYGEHYAVGVGAADASDPDHWHVIRIDLRDGSITPLSLEWKEPVPIAHTSWLIPSGERFVLTTDVHDGRSAPRLESFLLDPAPPTGLLGRLRHHTRLEAYPTLGPERGVRLSRNREYFTRHAEDGLSLVHASDGSVAWRRDDAEGVLRGVDGWIAEPDIDRIFGIDRRSNSIVILRFDGTTVQRLAGHGARILDLVPSADGRALMSWDEVWVFRRWRTE